jgi:chemotaxis methyl-accepting protein methylase
MSDAEADEELAPILAELRARTGVDFARYRSTTVRRRIHNRMISVGISTLPEYLSFLKSSTDEASLLLDRIAIKVSRFYRHAPAWEALSDSALPALAQCGRPLSVWSAACGYGEEVYTLAMALDAAGLPGTILGTDIDSAAIAAAEKGRYAASAITDLPETLAARYLRTVEGASGDVEVAKSLRDRVSFARHDLIFAAAPGKDFDIVSCRNMVIYLRRDARDEALASITGALRVGGYLLMGEAEWPTDPFARILEPVSRTSRLFRKVAAR